MSGTHENVPDAAERARIVRLIRVRIAATKPGKDGNRCINFSDQELNVLGTVHEIRREFCEWLIQLHGGTAKILWFSPRTAEHPRYEG